MGKGRQDQRNPLVALEVPPFGPPVNAHQCEACECWFPTRNFYRGRSKQRARTCRECIAAGRRAPARTCIPGNLSSASSRRRAAFDRKRGRPRPK